MAAAAAVTVAAALAAAWRQREIGGSGSKAAPRHGGGAAAARQHHQWQQRRQWGRMTKAAAVMVCGGEKKCFCIFSTLIIGKEVVCPDGLFVPAVFRESDFYLNSLIQCLQLGWGGCIATRRRIKSKKCEGKQRSRDRYFWKEFSGSSSVQLYHVVDDYIITVYGNGGCFLCFVDDKINKAVQTQHMVKKMKKGCRTPVCIMEGMRG